MGSTRRSEALGLVAGAALVAVRLLLGESAFAVVLGVMSLAAARSMRDLEGRLPRRLRAVVYLAAPLVIALGLVGLS